MFDLEDAVARAIFTAHTGTACLGYWNEYMHKDQYLRMARAAIQMIEEVAAIRMMKEKYHDGRDVPPSATQSTENAN